ncbi:uncharacterized protein At3g28850 [Cornus florida]|uniref:uncharacterized protein At3g28850 n=1 Tax=Cornus florida TaxID=4283 RepID=UPI00289ED7A1|nr:uncharacterized protein At3g28850 [Cornus florida]
MGCVSSKHYRKDLKQEIRFGNGDYTTSHVVSLTSSTYGVLQLDKPEQSQSGKECVMETKRSSSVRGEEAQVIINAWELMEGLEEGLDLIPIPVQVKKSPKSRLFLHGFADIDTRRSPLKFLNQMGGSPRKKTKKFGGKENKGRVFGHYSPKRILNLKISVKGSAIDTNSPRSSTSGPLFDPELVASLEKEMSEGEEQIKKMVSTTPMTQKSRISRDCSESMLSSFEKKCPPGGENAVVIYTTTLRGIRKTFEECNSARSIIGSHYIQVFERDVSMDSGFREELRGLMGTKEVKVPLVFVKGRLIGGADEVVRLEEEGKLGILFRGIPRALTRGCEGCAGVRFVMCMDCSGSCKVLDEDGKNTVRCGECNENGLIQCPICC